MKQFSSLSVLGRVGLAALLATAALPAAAQTAGAASPIAATPAMAAGVLEPEAAAALDRMGAHLRSLKAFDVVSTGTTESVYANGQKLQFLQRTHYTVRFPNQMTVEIKTDRQNRRVYFDGKALTIVAPNAKLYTTLPFTGTVGEVLTKAYDDWGVDFPLQDLFRWGESTSTAEKPSEGLKIGAARIGEHQTTHYAFRQTGVDFQIWIDEGDKPLPRKLVITNTESPAQPQYVAYFQWDVAPKIAANAFAFVPPKDFKRIDIGAGAAAAGK